MKFSFFNSFAVVACAVAVLCSPVHAKKDTVAQVPCVADPGLEMFCDPSSHNQLDAMFQSVFDKIPQRVLNSIDHRNNRGMTSAERRRQNAVALARQQGIFSDIKSYFVTYWHNLKLIFQGNFSEGIFNQLKNAGSWCEKDSWIVKAIKAGINAISGGALNNICDCVYPMVKNYRNFHELVADLEAHGLTQILGKCTNNLRKQIKGALKKSDAIAKKNKSIKPRM
ncbi:hypothetical protein B0O80DRAFT_465341 [Mortierella sp. GBAus27b]|nr:hypothetical protein BGX31_007080 [Mortierella sp. GBA43]KAI8347536.1 hypothetical protein B0O80DRAFT_465341 [Mortierella sp. GBAus27b]